MKKMYTKATPALKELWEKYEGEKWVTTDSVAYVDYFENLAKYSDDSPSSFYGFSDYLLSERLEYGYVEVSEREFAKFFDLEKELDEWYDVGATSGTQINTPYITETLEAYKEKDGKITWEVDFEFLEEIAKRMDASTKYPPYNWHNPIDHRELLKAGWRHYVQLMKGHLEDDGQEYGHIFAVVTNLMMVYYQLKLKQNG